jgi:hypothetical protein
MSYSDELFEGKSLSDVFSDIYRNTDNKRNQINTIITKLITMVATPDDAVVIGPIIKDYLDVNVKNDEHIVRLAQIAQRLVSVTSKGKDFDGFLTESEKEALLRDVSSELDTLKKDSEEVEDGFILPPNIKP